MVPEQNGRRGYAHPSYAQSFSDIATPIALPNSGATVLARPIGDTGLRDIMGAYPLFACEHWEKLPADLAALAADFVSMVAVADPACPLSAERLAGIFTVVRPLGPRYLIDLTRFAMANLGRHHARKLKRASAGRIDIMTDAAAAACGEDFAVLYRTLAARKGITGFRRLSDRILARQLAVPGTVAVVSHDDDGLLGIDVYYQDGAWAYAHLSAYSERGYDQSVSYPMMAAAIDYFGGRVDRLDLGGAPQQAGADGIAFFKAGWSNATCPTLLCGAVLRDDDYRRIAGSADIKAAGYFPAYRAGEAW